MLSRCQRFDLRRVGADVIAGHLRSVCGREGIEAEAEALATIASLAGGSVSGLAVAARSSHRPR